MAPQHDSPRYWALNLSADAQAWHRGRKRFWIEPTFQGWKSYGFDLEQSQIDEPARLKVLLFGHCLDHILSVAPGRLAGPARYSLRALTMGWTIPVGFTVQHG